MKNFPVTGEEFAAPPRRHPPLNHRPHAITYPHDDLITLSAVIQQELLGKNPNSVRPPAIPPTAFPDPWVTITQGYFWQPGSRPAATLAPTAE